MTQLKRKTTRAKHSNGIVNHSLTRFLNQRYLAILLSLSITFVAMILFMRNSAMDDTTDYYMHYDATVLSDYYQLSDTIAEFDPGIKEYYWGISRLPTRYQTLLNIELDQSKLKKDQTQLYSLKNESIYILPFYSKEKAEIFFVIHIFDMKNETLFYQTWQNAFIIFFTLFLLIVILFIFHTNRQITRQMASFTSWLNTLSHFNYSQLQQEQTPKQLKFEELVSSAQYLQISLLAQHELQRKEQELLLREKYFIACLSHELRTPIAIISAALTLLNKSETITAKDQDKLVKLSKAHRKMKQLTHTLLHLWRGEQGEKSSIKNHIAQNKVFLLAELIEQAVSSCQQQFIQRNINFSVSMNNEASLFSQYELAEILIQNLLCNACQYSADGIVKVHLNHHNLVVENTVNEMPEGSGIAKVKPIPENTTIPKVNYGYGLGLFLAEKICQQQQWTLEMSSTEKIFTTKVTFNNEKDLSR